MLSSGKVSVTWAGLVWIFLCFQWRPLAHNDKVADKVAETIRMASAGWKCVGKGVKNVWKECHDNNYCTLTQRVPFNPRHFAVYILLKCMHTHEHTHAHAYACTHTHTILTFGSFLLRSSFGKLYVEVLFWEALC